MFPTPATIPEESDSRQHSAADGDTSGTVTVNTDPFRSLPNELVLKILSHLSVPDLALRISLINNKFKDLHDTASLWKRLVFPSEDKLDLRTALHLLEHFKHLQHLKLSRSQDAGEIAIYAVKYCSRLTSLDMGYFEGDLNVRLLLTSIFESGVNLRSLCLGGSFIPQHFAMAAAGLANITHLKLKTMDFSYLFRSDVCQFDDIGLRSIADHCRFLVEFDARCIGLGLTAEGLVYFLSKVKGTLKCLALRGYGDLVNDPDVLAECTLLEKLSLYFAHDLTDTALLSITRMSGLTSLVITHARYLDGANFVTAFNGGHLQRLEYLNLDGAFELHDDGLEAIATNCPRLRELSLRYDRDEYRLCNAGQDNPEDGLPTFTNDGLHFLLSHCGALEILALAGMDGLTLEAFVSVNLSSRLKQLRLDEVCAESIGGEEGLNELESWNPNLKVYHMKFDHLDEDFMQML